MPWLKVILTPRVRASLVFVWMWKLTGPAAQANYKTVWDTNLFFSWKILSTFLYIFGSCELPYHHVHTHTHTHTHTLYLPWLVIQSCQEVQRRCGIGTKRLGPVCDNAIQSLCDLRKSLNHNFSESVSIFLEEEIELNDFFSQTVVCNPVVSCKSTENLYQHFLKESLFRAVLGSQQS